MDCTFDLATEADDPALRHLLATTPLPGSVTVTYEREPNYFLGCPVMGHFYQVPVARCCTSGQLAGFAFRAVRSCFVNGQIEPVGYLGQLRVDRAFHGQGLTARGFHYLHELHADGRVPGYLASLTSTNTRARHLLVDHPQPHFPRFSALDTVVTLALIVRPRPPLTAADINIVHGAACDLDRIVAFLHEHGRQRQFFPVYRASDFQDSPTTRGFRVEDFCLARYKDAIVGVIGLWDQSAYKQTVVQAYHHALRWLRPGYNRVAPLFGVQPLPAPGQPLRSVYASFVCIDQRFPAVFPVLLRYVLNLAATRGYAYVLLGMSLDDPLLTIARRYAHIPYTSRLYAVTWDDTGGFYERRDQCPAYVDIAAM